MPDAPVAAPGGEFDLDHGDRLDPSGVSRVGPRDLDEGEEAR